MALKQILIGALTAAAGVAAGLGVALMLKPDVTTYLVDTIEIDYDGIRNRYEAVKKKGDLSLLSATDAAQMTFLLFGEEEQNYSLGVGSSVASIVTQKITARSVKDKTRFFEESNSEGIVNLFDRMYREGDSVKTYWGDDPSYQKQANSPETMTADAYREIMGRTPSESLIYVVAPESLSEKNLSGDPETGVSKTEDGLKIELELDPAKGVANYVKQMKTISNLARYPTFDYCHLTIYTDSNLNLIRFETHEKYFATTSSGVGSSAEGRLHTVYYHNSLPSYGFPEPGDTLPAFPASV